MVSVKERDKVLDLVAEAEQEGGRPTAVSERPDHGCLPVALRRARRGARPDADPRGDLRPGRPDRHGRAAPSRRSRWPTTPTYGLISYVFAGDQGEGIRVGRRLESGMVAVNRGVASDPAAPFGGMKESGLGREGGFAGIHEFLETQYIAVDL